MRFGRTASVSHRYRSSLNVGNICSNLGSLFCEPKKQKRELAFALSDCVIRKLDVLVECLLDRILGNIADDLLLHFAVFKDQ